MNKEKYIIPGELLGQIINELKVYKTLSCSGGVETLDNLIQELSLLPDHGCEACGETLEDRCELCRSYLR